jgi:4-hydroxy-L-threonine phosphate dehydrogenase PdxA
MNGNPGLLAVSMGDPAGIGPEIVARALADPGSGRCVVRSGNVAS